MEDAQLLQQYLDGSEDAFGELVKRYIDLVYSVAVRQGDAAHLAQDIVQTVFADLAVKARRLPKGVLLGGWLYQHTRFVSAQAARAERRRLIREAKAHAVNSVNQSTGPGLDQWIPLLNRAIGSLAGADRDAVILRYFQKRQLREVGDAMGCSEEAARKRVDRAIERIRTFFKREGVIVSATTLTAGLEGQAVLAAPSAWAATVTAAALAHAATGSGLTLGVIQFMAMTKLKTAAVSGLIAAALVLPVWQEVRIERLKRSYEQSLAKHNARTPMVGEIQPASQNEANASELRRLRNAEYQLQSEIAKLRNQLGSERRLSSEKTSPVSKSASTEKEDSMVAFVEAETKRLIEEGKFSPELLRGAEEYAAKIRTIEQQRISLRLAELKKQFAITEDQERAIRDLLVANIETRAELGRQASLGKIKAADIRQFRLQEDEQIKALLSPEQQDRYEAFWEEGTDRRVVKAATTELEALQRATGTLSEDQEAKTMELLIRFQSEEVLKQEVLKQEASFKEGGSNPNSTAATKSQNEQENEMLKHLLTDEQKIELLKHVLTAEQLKAYQQQRLNRGIH